DHARNCRNLSRTCGIRITLLFMNKGIITQIIGPVVDVSFEGGTLPAMYEALEVKNGTTRLVLEVQQHVGGNVVRSVAMGPTDGLQRSAEVIATGAPISVPVGKPTLGRMFNVLGET